MLPKVQLTSHSRMSGSRWVITPSWLSVSLRSFLYSSSVYSCHLFLISSASVRSIPFLSFIVPIIAWSVPLNMNVKHKHEVAQSCPTLCDPMDCSLPGSSVHGIFQAIVLECIAISFSKGSSQPRDRTQVFCIVDRRFTLVSLIFLKRSLVFPILLSSSISLHWSLRKAFLSLLAIIWNSAFIWLYLYFSPLLFTSLLFTAIYKASSDSYFAFLHFFFLGMVLIPVSCSMSWTSIHSSSGTLSITSSPLNLFLTSTV